MGPPSVKSLLWYLERSFEQPKDWKYNVDICVGLPWNRDTIMFVFSYIFQFISNLDDHHSHFTDAAVIKALELIATFLHHKIKRAERNPERGKPLVPTHEIGTKQAELSELLVSSFFPEVVPRFFTVPKIHHLNQTDQHKLHPNEIIAGFMNFLLQVLFHQTNIGEAEVQQWALVRKELSFLLALLGDIPFQCTHHHLETVEQTNILLAEFEVLANVAGSMVYDAVFSNHQMEANKFHAKTHAWSEEIELLNAKIKRHCFKFSELPMSVISRCKVVDSFFIIHSLIQDIEDLKNHNLSFIHADDDIMELMRTLDNELTLSRSFIQVLQDNEEKQVLVQIRDLAYEAEYLINSLVVGNIQVWYLKIRLLSLTQRIKLAGFWLQLISDRKLIKASNGKVSFPTTGNMATMDDNHFLYFNLDVMERILKHESEHMKVSEMSYKHLPPEIKPCFLYFAAFPIGSKISKEKLTWLWIGEGLIPKQGNKSLEEAAEMYLLYLVDRKFVLVAKRGHNGVIKKCRMKSKLHEFCARKAIEENFIKFTNGFSMYEKCQRLCVARTKSCNSWRPFGLHCRSYIDMRRRLNSSCFQTMALLKVVDQSPKEYTALAFPAQLKYLNVTGDLSSKMVANLVNLEFIYVWSYKKVYIPSVVLTMVKLKHMLFLGYGAGFEEDCSNMRETTTNLRTLSGVCINGKKDEDIFRRWSPRLRKLKCRVTDVTRYPDVSFLTELESLKISYGDKLTASILSLKVNFPSTIKKLCLFGGKLPWEKMSIIGRLPNLHDLKLKKDAFKGKVWETRDGEFQKLKFLKLDYMSLKLWISCSEHFPVLESLVVDHCMTLCDIPSDFHNIPTLQMIRVISSNDNTYLSALQFGKEIQVYVENSFYLKEDKLVQKLRNVNRGNLMNMLSCMEEYYTAGGSQQGFINNKLLPIIIKDQTAESDSELESTAEDEGSKDSRRNLRIIDQTEDQTTRTNHETYFVVISFAMQFSSDLQKQSLTDTIVGLRLIAAAYDVRKECLPGHPHYVDEIKKARREFSDALVNSFIPQVQGFFQVPKIEHLSDHNGDKHLNKNEILAGFMDFLLQMFFSEVKSGLLGADQCALLHKELSFLRAIMGDIPFEPTDHPEFDDQVNNILAEFEMFANEAGGILRSRVFPTEPINGSRNHAETNALLGMMKILNAKIKEHCCNFTKLPVSAIVRFKVVDSFFIVETIVQDLQSVIMNCQLGNLTLDDDTKEHIKQLHGELTLSEIFFEFIRDNDIDEKKEGLIQIRDLAYEAEYLINSLGVGSIHLWYLNLRLPSIISRIKIVCIGLQQISSESKNASEVKASFPITGNTASIDANHLMDINDDTSRWILEDLTRKSNTSRQFISIFGMPGLGKTTTASKVYNGKAAFNHFDRRAWCVVSEKYNVRGLFNQILVGLGNANIAPEENDARVGEEIHKTLKGRRYLIILDDLWDSKVLDRLQIFFPDDGNGSRIIITTRNRDVSPCGSIIYELPFLSEDQCWNLLEKKVFLDGSCPSHLVSIGKRIAARCSGVPLAVVTIAGVLVNVEKEESEWERVEEGLSTILLDDQSDYRKTMDLSYHHLPPNIKPCFLSFAGYPEDAEISKKELIRFWIALQFIQKDGDKCPEDIGEMYLLDLINRSLVIIAERTPGGEIKTCKIHDLLRDLCIKRSDEDNFLNSTNLCSIYDKHQHLCHPYSLNSNRRPSGLHCRFFTCNVEQSFGIHMMALLKAVVLFGEEDGSSDNQPVADLPCQLRYLGIVGKVIVSKRILDNLVELEFFRVRAGDDVVVHIPWLILRMAKLKHMLVRDRLKFEEDSSNSSISERTNLRSLSVVVIATKKDEEILRNSPHLQTLKCIIEGEEVPDLSSHAELESLRMKFTYRIDHVDLKFLPSTIKKLCLERCFLPWEKMSIIGQMPKLEVLKLEWHAFVGEEWETK